MKLCLVGDATSIHLRRWAEHFSKSSEVIVISDSEAEIPDVRVVKVFERGSGLLNLFRVPRMRKLVRDFDPDIVHGHYLTVGGFYASLSGGKRLVGSAWGSDIYQGPLVSRRERFIIKFVLRRMHFIFAGTKDMAEKVREFGYDGEMALFRFGVDQSVFKRRTTEPRTEFRILAIRQCESIYNPMKVVDAFRIALPSMKGAVLILIDSGSEAGKIRTAVESDPVLSGRVRFREWRPYSEMPWVYSSADVGVSIPSSDSAAASVLEAMACELPVIVCDIPNMREWVDDGVNGYVTRIDEHDLAEKMKGAYANRGALPEMGRLARARVLAEGSQGTFEENVKVAEDAYRTLTSQ